MTSHPAPRIAARALGVALGMAASVGCGSPKFTLIEVDAQLADASTAPEAAHGANDASDERLEGAADAPPQMPPRREGGVEASGISNSGDCVEGDCGADRCVELTPGGYRTCIGTVAEASSCSVPPGTCCRSATCGTDAGRAGKCVAGAAVPACRAPALATNTCVYDLCRAHEDCAASGAKAICVPAGGFGRKAAFCLPAGCRVDSDCREQAGGACLTVSDPCCTSERVAGLYCVYGNGCRNQGDCATGEYCQVEGARTRCVAGTPVCGVTP